MKYTANTPILHDGKRVDEGGTLELDDDAAKRLGSKVTPIKPVKEEKKPT